MLKFYDEAKLKAGVWLRERREKAEERKAQKRRKSPAPHGAAPLVWVWFLAFIAVATLIGSTWMLMVFIAGSVGSVDWGFDWRAGNDGEPQRWTWFAQAQIHLLVGIGLLCFCLGIAAFNAVWLHVRTHLYGLFRVVVTTLGVLVALFMVSGAIVVQQWGTVARERDEIVATNTARAGVAAVGAEIQAIETEMARLCAPNLTTYQAQACRSGEAAWAERMATAREQRDYQLPGIERAMADARQGDRWRARLLELRQQHAVAAVETVEAEAQQVEVTGWMTAFSRLLEDIRKPFIAVLGELLAMTMFGVALAAALSRRQTVAQSGWAAEDHRIEDLREEEAITPQPMKAPREEIYDAETGERLIKVRGAKDHFRKAGGKKGKPQKIDIQPDIPPDETGVAADGGGRQAVSGIEAAPEAIPVSLEPTDDPAQPAAEKNAHSEDDETGTESITQPEPSTYDAELEAALEQELEPAPPQVAVDAPDADEQHEQSGEPDQQSEHVEPREEPETREDRLIASVAAE